MFHEYKSASLSKILPVSKILPCREIPTKKIANPLQTLLIGFHNFILITSGKEVLAEAGGV